LNQRATIYVAAPILDEYQRVLLYPRLKFVPAEVAAFLARLSKSSVVVTPTRTIQESADEADNRFLECAESAVAHYLVTGNKRHFPKIWKTTKVVNARELLRLIGSSLLDSSPGH